MDACREALLLFLQLQSNFRKRKRLKYEGEADEDDDEDLATLFALKGFRSDGKTKSQNKRTALISSASEKVVEAAEVAEIPSITQNVIPYAVSMFYLDDFKSHFHIGRESVEALTTLVAKEYVHEEQPGRRPLPVLNAVLLMVWTLANQESFRIIGSRFRVGGGHAHRAFIMCCLIICKSASSYLVWPKTAVAVRKTILEFEALRENAFPGVLGCIGGTHISIKAPNEDREVYINGKGKTSVIVQAVCDANLKFTDVYAGFPGSFNNGTVWRNSLMYECIKTYSESWVEDTHILGDVSYPVTEYLITPYKDDDQLSQKQQHFNALLNSTLVVIGQAFSLLKSRFRRLKYLEMSRMDLIPKLITAACVMHNMCIDLGDIDVEVESDDTGDQDEDDSSQDIAECVCLKRDYLLDQLK